MNKKSNPLVSVCVVTYNHEKYIRQCILSIINQKIDSDFEIIIGDDCSTDGTAKILREIEKDHPNVLKIIIHKNNIGGTQNYKAIHKLALGRYVAHIDGDDFWLPGKLAQQVNFLEENPECSSVYSNSFLINKFEENFGKFNKKVPRKFDRNFLLRNGNFLNASSLVYRNGIQKNILPDDLEFIDYRVHLRCSLYGLLGYINEPLVSYRVLSTGTASKYTKKVTKLYWSALSEAFEQDGISPAMKSAVTDFMGTVFCRAIIEKDPSTAKKWINTIHAETKISKNYIIIFGLFKATAKIVNSAKKRLLRSLNMSVTFASR